jgi:hypothetical protein
MIFIPESPRWLILNDRYDEGRKALLWLRPDGFDVDAEASDIKGAIDKEMENSSGVGWVDMFSNPVDRRRTALAVCSVTLQAASGAMFLIGKSRSPRNPKLALTCGLQLISSTSSPWPRFRIHSE